MEKPSLAHEIIHETGYTEIKCLKKQTVADLLSDLKLEDAFLAVLVDGEKANLDDEIDETQKIIILPKIAGGSN
jgi:sulfur carrier protein ThiS